MHAKRKRILIGITLFTVLVATVGILASTRVKSTAQVAADAAPPPRTVLTAPVETAVVRRTVVTRGVVTSSHNIDISLGSAYESTRLVLTSVRKVAGSDVAAGEVIVEVSGRPLFALLGRVPAYRDLRPGLSGRDVQGLQAGLRRLGISPGSDKVGYYGSGTKRAVVTLYKRIGYEPALAAPVGALEDALPGAIDAVTQAQRRVEDLGAQLANELAVEAQAPPGSSAKPKTPEVSRTTRRQLRYAREDAAGAELRRTDLQKGIAESLERSGPMVPMTEIAFIPSFPARVISVNSAVGADVVSPLLKLSAGELLVEGQLDPSDAGFVRPSSPVAIDAESASLKLRGTVSAVGRLVYPGKDNGSGTGDSSLVEHAPYIPVTVKPEKMISASLIGLDVRLTVESARSVGEVLAVPQSAITAEADGATYVTVLKSGALVRISVAPGLSGDGRVEVRPLSGSLQNGDEVVISQ